MPARSQLGLSTNSLLRGLNDAQREAVTTTEGPLLVLAGAGTGKTRVITYRVAYLVRRGVPPDAILAVTFTNKAAREMRERVSNLLGSKPKGLTLSTFHSLGARILRACADQVNLRSNFTIYDTSDQVALLRSILRDIRGAVTTADARGVHAKMSLAKNRGLRPEDLIDEAEDDAEYLIGRAYHRYQEQLATLNCVDFDDLIRLPVELLEASEETRERYQRQFRYILIDEYQDTNGAQYRLTRCLVSPERNLCVVGDDDQSIYGFRGAELDKILRFERDFSGAKVVKLENNYRSTGQILALANSVIASSPLRHPKVLRSTLDAGAPVEWVMTADGHQEVDFVVGSIQRLRAVERLRYEDVAILIRSASQARPFEEKLRVRRIPYTLVGGQSFFDRKEVRDVVAYWNVVNNPRDDMSLLRIINFPRRGLGDKSVRALDELARSQRVHLLKALEDAAAGEGSLGVAARKSIGKLCALFEQTHAQLRPGDFASTCRQFLSEVGYESAVRELYPDPLTAHARWNAVELLLESAERWEKDNPSAPFGDFLASLVMETTASDDNDNLRGVALMTLHSAKGLEFPVVFLVGLEEDILPHRKSIEEGDHAVEEERRILYVGVTRARQRLILTTAATRNLWGKTRERLPSRFLGEIEDTDLFQRHPYNPGEEASREEVQGYLEEFKRRVADDGERGREGEGARDPGSP